MNEVSTTSMYEALCTKYPLIPRQKIETFVTQFFKECKTKSWPVDELTLRLVSDFTTQSDIESGQIHIQPHLAIITPLTRKNYTTNMQHKQDVEKSLEIYSEYTIPHDEKNPEKPTQCRKCHGERLIYYMKQVRSSDEPTSEYGECMDCYFKWRIC